MRPADHRSCARGASRASPPYRLSHIENALAARQIWSISGGPTRAGHGVGAMASSSRVEAAAIDIGAPTSSAGSALAAVEHRWVQAPGLAHERHPRRPRWLPDTGHLASARLPVQACRRSSRRPVSAGGSAAWPSARYGWITKRKVWKPNRGGYASVGVEHAKSWLPARTTPLSERRRTSGESADSWRVAPVAPHRQTCPGAGWWTAADGDRRVSERGGLGRVRADGA